jgi:hypothetical protein
MLVKGLDGVLNSDLGSRGRRYVGFEREGADRPNPQG